MQLTKEQWQQLYIAIKFASEYFVSLDEQQSSVGCEEIGNYSNLTIALLESREILDNIDGECIE